MPDTTTLANRMDAEFAAVTDKVKKLQARQMEDYKQREKRLGHLNKVFEQMREMWRPRLELLMKKFEGRVEAKPRIIPSTREVTFEFQSRIARVHLKLSAFTDRQVQKVILSYDLEIIPALMAYKHHDELEFPLNAVDMDAATKWMDDRIVEFVRTYFSMGEHEIYLKDEMVEDPIAHMSFPKFAAGTTLEWGGKTFYFIGQETRAEFEKQNGIGPK